MRRFLSCVIVILILLFCVSGGCQAVDAADAMTRAQAAELIYNACGAPCAVYDGRFADVGQLHTQCAAIYWLAEAEISYGTGDGYYSPDRAITLGEYETMLARLCTLLGREAKDSSGSTELLTVAGGQKLLDRLFYEY